MLALEGTGAEYQLSILWIYLSFIYLSFIYFVIQYKIIKKFKKYPYVTKFILTSTLNSGHNYGESNIWYRMFQGRLFGSL